MKIRCEKKDLLTAVSNVSRAAPAKSPIPALEGILFEAADGGLKLTASCSYAAKRLADGGK